MGNTITKEQREFTKLVKRATRIYLSAGHFESIIISKKEALKASFFGGVEFRHEESNYGDTLMGEIKSMKSQWHSDESIEKIIAQRDSECTYKHTDEEARELLKNEYYMSVK